MDNPERTRILPRMRSAQDILIAGGGLNGACLALAAARAGLSVTLVDRAGFDAQKSEGFDGRSYALALASTRMLSALGVWQSVAAGAQPILDIRVSDGRVGEGAGLFGLHFDHHEIDEGPMGFMVEDRHLRPALIAALEATPGITLVDGVEIASHRIEAGHVAAVLSNESEIAARVLIGCDGRGSMTAQRAGIKRTGWAYGQTALVCAIAHEQPHEGVAHQFFMPSGPLAILPLTENRSSIVWTESTDQAARISAMDAPAYLDVLRPRFGSYLGEISLAGARYSYPLALSLANSFVADRVALVGDAAHGVHPIAGQGLNAGLRDVAALTEVFVDANRRGEDIASPVVLARYQEWRRFDAMTLGLATDAFNRMFSNDNPVLRGLRGLGMGVVNALPGLRRSFIREAAGLSGEVPCLLKGEMP